jgi:hypothetical protein
MRQLGSGTMLDMKQKPGGLNMAAGFTIAAIVGIAGFVARRLGGAEHPLLLCVGVGVVFFVLALGIHWLVRQG